MYCLSTRPGRTTSINKVGCPDGFTKLRIAPDSCGQPGPERPLERAFRHHQLDTSDSGDDSDTSSSCDAESMALEGAHRDHVFAMTVTKLTDLMFYHKQAFEAESAEAAEPTLALLCQARRETKDKDLPDSCPGQLVKGLLGWDTGRDPRDFPEGCWKDGSGSFYRGSKLEIGRDSWRPEGFQHGDSHSVTYTRESGKEPGEHVLLEQRGNGESRRFSVTSLDPEDQNCLQVVEGMSKWTLVACPVWDRWKHYTVLEDVWREMTTTRIGKIISVLGPRANRFLHALAVKIPASLEGKLCLHSSPTGKVVVAPGNFCKCDEESLGHMVPHKLKTRVSPACCRCGANQDFWRNSAGLAGLSMGPVHTRVSLYFCGVQGLLDFRTHPRSRKHSLDHLKFLLHLNALPNEARVFTPPLGQAAAANCWHLALPQFVWQRAMDVALLVSLGIFLSPAAHSFGPHPHPRLPRQWQIVLVVLLTLRSSASLLVELVVLRRLIAEQNRASDEDFRDAPVPRPLNLFTLIRYMLEGYSLMWGCRLVDDYFVWNWKVPESVTMWERPYMGNNTRNLADTCLAEHPMGLGVLIFTKYLQFTMALLNVRPFRGTLLPAWYAIKCPESVAFLAYMLFLTFGCALAYIGLPFHEENRGTYGMSPWPLLRMFRLNIMGDFDLDKLEGTTQTLVPHGRNCTGGLHGNCTWDIEDPANQGMSGSLGLQTFVCALALLFPVIFLNVYVGLVSEAYQTFKNNLTQISCGFVVDSTLREMLQRQFWMTNWRGRFSLELICSRTLASYTHKLKVANEARGIWICMPSSLVEDPLEVIG